jgi:hypothetical protein
MNAKDFAVETVESKRGCRNPKHFVLCAVECKRLDFDQGYQNAKYFTFEMCVLTLVRVPTLCAERL